MPAVRRLNAALVLEERYTVGEKKEEEGGSKKASSAECRAEAVHLSGAPVEGRWHCAGCHETFAMKHELDSHRKECSQDKRKPHQLPLKKTPTAPPFSGLLGPRSEETPIALGSIPRAIIPRYTIGTRGFVPVSVGSSIPQGAGLPRDQASEPIFGFWGSSHLGPCCSALGCKRRTRAVWAASSVGVPVASQHGADRTWCCWGSIWGRLARDRHAWRHSVRCVDMGQCPRSSCCSGACLFKL